jgi:hypothetical protein
VANVKRCRRDTSGPEIPLFFRQRRHHCADAFAHLEKNMRDGLKNRRNALDWAALPPFRICHCACPHSLTD